MAVQAAKTTNGQWQRCLSSNSSHLLARADLVRLSKLFCLFIHNLDHKLYRTAIPGFAARYHPLHGPGCYSMISSIFHVPLDTRTIANQERSPPKKAQVARDIQHRHQSHGNHPLIRYHILRQKEMSSVDSDIHGAGSRTLGRVSRILSTWERSWSDDRGSLGDEPFCAFPN